MTGSRNGLWIRRIRLASGLDSAEPTCKIWAGLAVLSLQTLLTAAALIYLRGARMVTVSALGTATSLPTDLFRTNRPIGFTSTRSPTPNSQRAVAGTPEDATCNPVPNPRCDCWSRGWFAEDPL